MMIFGNSKLVLLNANNNQFNKDKKKNKPLRALTYFNHNKNGRNNTGQITIRHKGGKHKKLYRFIDFKRNKYNTIGFVKNIEYDPNRNTKIALIFYLDGTKRYILCPQNLTFLTKIQTGINAKIQIGNNLQLQYIPVGIYVHNIEINKNNGGQLVRAAGTSAKILSKHEKYIIIRLPSKEIRLIHKRCSATIGIIKNSNLKKKKAGQNRWLGIRPTVRGIAMNACDHPHGGGEGRSPIGRKQPLTPWGKIALGKKTRKNKITNSYIIKRKK